MEKYVAISEEFPNTAVGKAKSGGNLFDRRVQRVVTPGTLIDETFLDPFKNNFLLSIFFEHNRASEGSEVDAQVDIKALSNTQVGLAWLDLSTGDFNTQVNYATFLSASIARIAPREIIVEPSVAELFSGNAAKTLGIGTQLFTSHAPSSKFRSMSDWKSLLENPIADGAEAAFSTEEKMASHNLLDYVKNRLQGLEMKLQPPHQRPIDDSMAVDSNAIRGLELLQTSRDGLGKGSLIFAVRRTKTSGGQRLLRNRLTSPSTTISEIQERLDSVEAFLRDESLREKVVEHLGDTYDIARLVNKFPMNKGEVDDLLDLSRAITAAQNIRDLLAGAVANKKESLSVSSDAEEESNYAKSIHSLCARLELQEAVMLAKRIDEAVDEEGFARKQRGEADEAADVAAMAQETLASEGLAAEQDLLPKKVSRRAARAGERRSFEPDGEETWIMRSSASEALSDLHRNLQALRERKTTLEQDLREKGKSSSLSLKWSPGLGYFCHLKSGSKRTIELLEGRQVSSTKTTQSAYIPAWTQLGIELDHIKWQIRAEEQRIFADLRREVIKGLVKLRRAANVLDELDISCSFAALAKEKALVRPILNNTTSHRIIGGRHPTVEIGLEENGRSFISNDLFLGGQERVWLVTGPNMAGKSTFLRQNALISIMAQMGSFVPADYAEIGIVDKIFSRIGAADDLVREQSTFMLEMVETAAILKDATSRSFVIMDEVGRGTTPEDGTAIGYACLHHLYHVNQCRTLFATHFHALADMTMDLPSLGRYCTDIQEEGNGRFHFSRKLKKGVNRQSHALKVARLAGLPEQVLEVATRTLERSSVTKSRDVEGMQPQGRTAESAVAGG